MNIILYGNGPSGNHGCEAIVRGTVELLGNHHKYINVTENIVQDQMYALDQVVSLIPAKTEVKKDFRFLKAYAEMKLKKDYTAIDVLQYMPTIERIANSDHIAFSIGGDNYCYNNTRLYAYLNREYNKNGMKTVLWGCSVEPDIMQTREVVEDLQRYSMIVARESVTYDALKQFHDNVYLMPDPAFYMQPMLYQEEQFISGQDYVGINVSPMIIANEGKKNIVLDNYRECIAYILKNTDYHIAFIPHVVWDSNDDRKSLRMLLGEYKNENRIVMTGDHSAPVLKDIISKCRFFIGARTHATIAAYSSIVPTIVMGYSVKARGIAKDIFGEEEQFICPVQKLSGKGELTETFIKLEHQEDNVKKKLLDYMKSHQTQIRNVKDALVCL